MNISEYFSESLKKKMNNFSNALFYHAVRDSEEHQQKIERLHKRISNVEKPRNKTPSVSTKSSYFSPHDSHDSF